MKELVIAHYDEPLEWLSGVDPTIWKTIYSKGKNNRGLPLPNIGRDTHTFLYHIVSRYHYLAEHTYFVHGDAPRHQKKIVALINTFEEWDKNYVPLSEVILPFEDNGFDTNHTPLKSYAERLGVETKGQFPFGAHMRVKKEAILSRPLNYYLTLLTLVSASKGYGEGDDFWPWAVEYFWPQIFRGE